MITTYFIPLLTNFTEYWILILFYSNFLESKKVSTVYTVVCLVGLFFSLGLYGINTFKIPVANTIGAAILMFLVATVLYNANTMLRIAFAVIFVTISATSEILFGFILLIPIQTNAMNLINNQYTYIAIGIVGKIILAFITVIIIKIFPRKYGAIKANDIILLLAFPLFGISATHVILYLSNGINLTILQNMLLIILELGLLISGVMMFFVYDNAMHKQDLENQLKISQQAFEMNELLFKEQQRSIEVDRANNHDFKFHLNNIKNLYQQGSSEAIAYHNDLIRQFEEAESLNVIDVNNHVISNIFERVRRQCNLNDITLDMQIKYNQLGFINPLDACALFDNAFDNAISACMQIESGRWIKATLVKRDYYVIISILNSKLNQVINENGKLLSTKRAYKASGYGVESIKAVAEKYGGDSSMKFSENEFELIIRLKDIVPT